VAAASSRLTFSFINCERLGLFRREEKAMAGLPEHPHVAPRIVFDDDCQMRFAFIVLLDGFDDGSFSGERQVKDIAPGARPQPNTVALLNLRAVDADTLQRRLLFQQLPLPLIHFFSEEKAKGKSKKAKVSAETTFINFPELLLSSLLPFTFLLLP
jgi:hypothetical protein